MRNPLETWAAKVFRRGASTFVGTGYREVVDDLCSDVSETPGAPPRQDDEIPAMSSDDREGDREDKAAPRHSPPPSPDPGRTRAAMEALQFILQEVRKEKRTGLFLGGLLFVGGLLATFATYIEWESSGLAGILFVWALSALAVASGVEGFRSWRRPAEEDPAIVLLSTRPEQVVWAHIEIKKHNGRHHATALKLFTEARESLELPVPTTTEGAARAMALVQKLAPRATLGFSPESEALFASDPAALRRP